MKYALVFCLSISVFATAADRDEWTELSSALRASTGKMISIGGGYNTDLGRHVTSVVDANGKRFFMDKRYAAQVALNQLCDVSKHWQMMSGDASATATEAFCIAK